MSSAAHLPNLDVFVFFWVLELPKPKLKPKNQKKQNSEENVLVWGQKMFFVFPRVFLFFWFWIFKNQKNLGNFWFFEFTVSSKRGKTKNYLGFLGFSRAKIQKTKKKPRDCLFFWNYLVKQKRKKQKFPRFFLVFEDPKPKNKKTLGKPKNIFWPQTKTFSSEFWFFVFLVLVLVFQSRTRTQKPKKPRKCLAFPLLLDTVNSKNQKFPRFFWFLRTQKVEISIGKWSERGDFNRKVKRK